MLVHELLFCVCPLCARSRHFKEIRSGRDNGVYRRKKVTHSLFLHQVVLKLTKKGPRGPLKQSMSDVAVWLQAGDMTSPAPPQTQEVRFTRSDFGWVNAS